MTDQAISPLRRRIVFAGFSPCAIARPGVGACCASRRRPYFAQAQAPRCRRCPRRSGKLRTALRELKDRRRSSSIIGASRIFTLQASAICSSCKVTMPLVIACGRLTCGASVVWASSPRTFGPGLCRARSRNALVPLSRGLKPGMGGIRTRSAGILLKLSSRVSMPLWGNRIAEVAPYRLNSASPARNRIFGTPKMSSVSAAMHSPATWFRRCNERALFAPEKSLPIGCVASWIRNGVSKFRQGSTPVPFLTTF